jgi:hypothetical protein
MVVVGDGHRRGDGRQRFVVELVGLPSDRPVGVRLRALLRYALRTQSLRCVSIEPAPGPGGGAATGVSMVAKPSPESALSPAVRPRGQ